LCSSSKDALTNANTPSSSSKSSFFSSYLSILAFLHASAKDCFLALAKVATSFLLIGDRTYLGECWEVCSGSNKEDEG